jgi:hypothetical protein
VPVLLGTDGARAEAAAKGFNGQVEQFSSEISATAASVTVSRSGMQA